jgi:hypothetical protein
VLNGYGDFKGVATAVNNIFPVMQFYHITLIFNTSTQNSFFVVITIVKQVIHGLLYVFGCIIQTNVMLEAL